MSSASWPRGWRMGSPADPRHAALRDARVLVTGATGLVGAEVLGLLRDCGCRELAGVSRARSADGSAVVAWDMANEPPPPLQGSWDVIVNTAANTRWTMTPDEAFAANVATVAALRPLAGPGTLVIHVSTAYAVGLRDDCESEELGDYRNTYEWSKAAAERLARASFPRLAIVRPPLTIGRREDGRAARFTGMYLFLRGICAGTVPALVGLADAYFDVVPVDDLASLIAGLAADPAVGNSEVLTPAGGAGAPRVGRAVELMLAALNEWRAGERAGALAAPPILEPERWRRFFLPFARGQLTARQLRTLELLGNFEPYLQMTTPLTPTHLVDQVEDAIAVSAAYWAQRHRRLALRAPQPWRSAENTGRAVAAT